MGTEHSLVKQYAHQYLTGCISLILWITIPISALFFGISLRYDVLPYDWIGGFLPLLFGFAVFGYCYCKTRRFSGMIRRQEQFFHAAFPSRPLTPLYPKTLYYQCEDWFLRAGCWAFHRDSIADISIRVLGEKTPSRCYAVAVHTVDHRKIVLYHMRSGEIEKFKRWFCSPVI